VTRIVRFAEPSGSVAVGLADDAGDLRRFPGVFRVADLLRLSRDALRRLVEETARAAPDHTERDVLLLPPLDGRMEVWAAGVTYERSREARISESTEQTVYQRVYDAERPELFFKALPWRVVTDDEPVAVRADSPLNVPEPELGLVVNRHGETVGYLVVDDVSSRTIEGENPLYLPQAKVYAGSCAVSAAVVPAWEVPAPTDLKIRLTVQRAGRTAFEATTSTADFHRTPESLVAHLLRCQPFPDGAVLSTGTGIVPEMDFTLHAGDRVHIGIDGVGTLTNHVLTDTAALDWLVEAADKPLLRRAHRGGHHPEETP
jgi:2-dehydro-3-deoxy-D-arabinonate dehydratase